MEQDKKIEAFINPRGVAVVGASEKPGSWGSFVMMGMLSLNFPGGIFPVNPHADHIYGVRAYRDVREIPGPVDLAVLAIPEASVEAALAACGEKGVRGVTVITAGYGETSERGNINQQHLKDLAAAHDMRVLGPNVSGTFNLHTGFNASSTPGENLLATGIAAVCQGGYAFYDMLSVGGEQGYGVGWFIHTGNESDLTISDFLDHFGRNNDVRAIIMYIEAVRDGRRFVEAARLAAARKPVLVYKAGRTAGSARAARSHTGALAGNRAIYQGLFRQTGLLACPTMELLLPAATALMERPPMRGRRVGVITVGGSWGVALSDTLEETGLLLPEFSPQLQKALRDLGLPERASVKNPVDFGASGLFLSEDTPAALAREILFSGEVDALVVHGLARPGRHDETTADDMKLFLEIEKSQVKGIVALEKESGRPVLVGSHYNPWQSQTIADLNAEGYRTYSRLSDIARILLLLSQYGSRALPAF